MQLRFSPIINLLSTCRCVQLSADDDVADGDLARILCWSGARFERGTVPGVPLSLQEPPGEHHGAAEKREFHFSVLYLHQIHLDPPCVYVQIFLLTGRSVFRHHVQQCGGEQRE